MDKNVLDITMGEAEEALRTLEQAEERLQRESCCVEPPSLGIPALRTRLYALFATMTPDKTVRETIKSTKHDIFREAIQWPNAHHEIERCRDTLLALHHLRRDEASPQEIDAAEAALSLALYAFRNIEHSPKPDKQLLTQAIKIMKQGIALMHPKGRYSPSVRRSLATMEGALKNLGRRKEG